MSLAAKEALKAAQAALKAPTISPLLPNGVKVVTNVQADARFPLPLTLVSALVMSIGVLATMRGHKVIGVGALILGGAGLGAAAAAPELNAQIKKLQSKLGGGS